MSNKEWFVSWFNSHYYHLLYKKRDLNEAEFFIDNLIQYFSKNYKWFADDYSLRALDLACGKGRHSLYLNAKGFNVTGIDLSEKSISEAMKYETPHLKFIIGDMRNSFGNNEFNLVFNLFTSFGYFEEDIEEIAVLKNIYNCLKKDGLFVFDFLNVSKIELCNHMDEAMSIEGISFKIKKRVINRVIYKSIEVNDKGSLYNFEERVKLLDYEKMNYLLSQANFKITETFGNYNLDKFDKTSDRLILIAKKLS